jgi:hypothetical protein
MGMIFLSSRIITRRHTHIPMHQAIPFSTEPVQEAPKA